MTETAITGQTTGPAEDDSHPPPLRAAALVFGEGEGAGDLLEAFARRLMAQGVRVGGLVQRTEKKCGMRFLVDLESGARFPISQDLGKGSESCTIDAEGMAEATAVLRRALDDPPELLIVNKFGRLECEGEGLAAEALEAMAGGLAVLTTVDRKYLDAFEAVTGGLVARLAVDAEALERWWRSSSSPDRRAE